MKIIGHFFEEYQSSQNSQSKIKFKKIDWKQKRIKRSNYGLAKKIILKDK
jgi:hypothetical protein